MPDHAKGLATSQAANKRMLAQSLIPTQIDVDKEYERNLAKVRASHAPTLLLALKAQYQAKGIPPAVLADVAGIGRERLGKLYNSVGQEEPWLDEAVALHRILGTAGVRNLISMSGTLTDVPMGFATDGDVDALRAGLRLPLSLACRLTLKFGLDDPVELIPTNREVQVWTILEDNSRLSYDQGVAKACPWCLGKPDAALGGSVRHLDTCLPDALWGSRTTVPRAALGFTPRPQGSKPHMRGFSRKAPGLKPLRLKLGMTQAMFAHPVGIEQMYYARIERGEVPLSLRNAERIAAQYRVDLPSLFVEPVPVQVRP